MRKELGKISQATFGYGGYEDAMIGLSLTFSGDGWGCGTFEGTWATRSDSAKWTEAEQHQLWVKAVICLRDTLKAAKKMHVDDLVGVPIEASFDGGTLSSWRVLTEVL